MPDRSAYRLCNPRVRWRADNPLLAFLQQHLQDHLWSAAVLQTACSAPAGRAPDRLLDSYGAEREPVAERVLGLTHALVRLGTMTHPVKRALRNATIPAALAASPVHRRAVRRFTQVSVAYPASSLTKTDRGRGQPRPGQRVPDIEVLTAGGPSRLFTVLRGGRHVIVVTGADPDRALASPALTPYRDLFEVVTCRSGHAHTLRSTRAGSVLLVRPDGYLAARARPDKPETVLGYLKELCAQTQTSRHGRPTASGQPDPPLATFRCAQAH